MARLLIQVDGLRALERAGQWPKACAYLYCLWRQAPGDLALLNRAALQCWYVYLEAPVIGCPEDPDTLAQLRHMLLACAHHGLDHFQDQFAFLWALRYMLSVSPLPFAPDSTQAYLHWQSVGEQARERGLRLFPAHPLSPIAFETFSDMARYQAAKAQIANVLDAYFPGDSALEEYFREMYRA